MEINVSKDTPLSEIKDDAFHREPIVNTVVKVINNLCTQNENCFNIGIFGKWGEGKTTVLNFIKQKLLNQKDNIIIAEFNPWFFKDDESLYLDFFRTISNQSPDKKLAGVIKKYAPIVSLGLSGLSKIAALSMHPIVGGIIKMFNKCVNAFSKVDNSKSVSELKKDIDNAIDKSKKHYVIFIDDLDRLDKQELHSVLNLIKHTANFHNTIYIVAMDKDMVARSLNTEYDEEDNKNSGYDFLEKIFQLQIELPKIPSYRLYNSLMERITPLFEQCSLSNDNIEAIKMDRRLFIEPVLDSAREIVLISNILWAYLPLVYENVDVPDFCILQALKVLSPAMYQMIRNNKKRLVSKEIVVNPDMAYYNREPFYEDLKKNLNYDNQYDNVIRRLLGFPPFNLQETSRSLCTEFFDRYFVYEIADESSKEYENVQSLSELIVDQDTNAEKIANKMYQMYGGIDNDKLKIALHWIASKDSLVQKSTEMLNRLAIAVAIFSDKYSLNASTWGDFPVRWDKEIIRILNLMKVPVFEMQKSSLTEIGHIVKFDFYISILSCYYDEGGDGGIEDFKMFVADYLSGWYSSNTTTTQSILLQLRMEGQTLKLFYPWFKQYHQDEYNKFISNFFYSKDISVLCSFLKLFFNKGQTEEELKQSYNSYKELFNVDETYSNLKCVSIADREMNTLADQFEHCYSTFELGNN
ncbi:MAG: KAP family NTPase [Prevotella sp.]|jgi:DNA replication protein DnaC|nr:KAP family NTPase [Prevotella sp.]MCI1474836.1 KAP family NTPase [Prevotella sp.]MCI1549051.1 KAP family NTPase [Prevotella sp.]MCI1596707.1 KAP family NTPase [Prevotella sp.]HAT62202.1 hypothetical protein [Prevotella sp.]